MATKKPLRSPVDPPEKAEAPPAGCVFMWRIHPDDGHRQRTAVNVASGSVEVMAAGGWSTEAPPR